MLTRSLALLALLACAAQSTHAQTSMRLCTARVDGNYFKAGGLIRDAADPGSIDIDVIETVGSMDNLERLWTRRGCPAAIVQADAYLLYRQDHASQDLAITDPVYLYDELAHLVCRRDARAGDLNKLVTRGGARILVGDASSGGALTWRSFVGIDKRLASAKVEERGGDLALMELRMEPSAGCMFFVAGPGTGLARSIDELGQDLTLVPVPSEAFTGTGLGRQFGYLPARIEKGTYPTLQTDAVETVAVRAALVVRASWADEHPAAYEALVAAAKSARPRIEALGAP